ncbi:hypothetical protein B0H17DRAFT_1206256 [Mycena rosella]|uniref:Uncharacterized protein n=1 Tax=Mycena rosella TaxID=1033263 RepID=A0AAD7D5G9_MYCRO|nr:hypothetical protein B0H17DRAFT_1206256 [Mycena rosella]
MDDEPHTEAELHSPQTMDEQRDQFAGAFFPQAQHFVIAGGNFNSINNITQVAPDPPSDFRRFPIGDLDLRNEIRLAKSGQGGPIL